MWSYSCIHLKKTFLAFEVKSSEIFYHICCLKSAMYEIGEVNKHQTACCQWLAPCQLFISESLFFMLWKSCSLYARSPHQRGVQWLTSHFVLALLPQVPHSDKYTCCKSIHEGVSRLCELQHENTKGGK